MGEADGADPGAEQGPRASDADRDRFAARLHEQFANGRLTQEELEERLERVLRARTLVELYAVTADLPHPGPRPVVGWPRERRWWRRRG